MAGANPLRAIKGPGRFGVRNSTRKWGAQIIALVGIREARHYYGLTNRQLECKRCGVTVDLSRSSCHRLAPVLTAAPILRAEIGACF
jgi:hypothetical protein